VVREVATPLVTSAVTMLFGAFFLLLFVLPRFGRDVRQVNKRRGVFLFVSCGLAGGVAMTAMFYAFHYSQVAVVSSVSNVYPIFALLFAHLFLQHLERITARIWVGTFLVIIGVVLITWSQLS
jgi:drug/metabolite transporter (DMT)-like permease